MRLFALEYYRQLIQSDLTHFHSAKKKAHLKFKHELGPFIMNKKEGWEEADLILKDKYKLSYSFRWVHYDPQGFITARRNKYRLIGIKHCQYSHIEKYANLQEWQMDTLVENLTEEERMLKSRRELENTIDLDYVQHVPFRPPYSIGEGTSATKTAPQAPSTSAPVLDKGKGIMGTEEEVTKEKPAPEAEQQKGQQQEQQQGKNVPPQTQLPAAPTLQIPPPQKEPVTAPILQTPAHEERGTKRDREESTPLSGSSHQPEAKRQRADSTEVEDITDDVLESERKDKEGSQHTGTSSFQQEQTLQLGLEVSSSSQLTKKPKNTKASFKQIKAQNELLRAEVYKQFVDATPAQQERLLSVYDIQQEKLLLSHFKPMGPEPKTPVDFIKTRVEVLARDIHPMDQVELHKQTGEMVYATLVEKATLAHELKESLKNNNTQLDFERLSSQAKDNRIKSLEEIIIDLGHDPSDRTGVKAHMKKKDDDLNALKKRLKLQPTEHPQTTELQKQKRAEDQLDLLM